MLRYLVCFNPLDRGNLYQIYNSEANPKAYFGEFQSPRSGKFVSDEYQMAVAILEMNGEFQSPRSGKFVSDTSNILSSM